MKAVDTISSLLDPGAPQAGDSSSKDTSAQAKKFDAVLAKAVEGEASSGKGAKLAVNAGKPARSALPGRSGPLAPAAASAKGAELPAEKASAESAEGGVEGALSDRDLPHELPLAARSVHESIAQAATRDARGKAGSSAVDTAPEHALEIAVREPAQTGEQHAKSAVVPSEPEVEDVEPTLPSVQQASAALQAVLESVATVVARIVAPASSAQVAPPTTQSEVPALAMAAEAPRAHRARNLGAQVAPNAPLAAEDDVATVWGAIPAGEQQKAADGTRTSELPRRTPTAAEDLSASLRAPTAPRDGAEAKPPVVATGANVGPATAAPIVAGTAITPALVPPQTGALVPPQTGALVPPQTGALVPPQTGALVPPQTGARVPPQTGAREPLGVAPGQGSTVPRGEGVAVATETTLGRRADVSTSTVLAPQPAASPAGAVSGQGTTASASVPSPIGETKATTVQTAVPRTAPAASPLASAPDRTGDAKMAASAPLAANAAASPVASSGTHTIAAEGAGRAGGNRAAAAKGPANAMDAAPVVIAGAVPAAATAPVTRAAATRAVATPGIARPAEAAPAAAGSLPTVAPLATAAPAAAGSPGTTAPLAPAAPAAATPAASEATAPLRTGPHSARPVTTPATVDSAPPAATPLAAATLRAPLAAPVGELVAAQNQPLVGSAANRSVGFASRGQRTSGQAADEPIAPLRGFTRGALVGQAMSAYGGRGHDAADQQSAGGRLSEERESRPEDARGADVFGVVDPSAFSQQHQPTPEATPTPNAGAQPALPVPSAQPVVELPTVEFAARPPAAQSENASISLHHPDLGPIRLEVQRTAGRIEVHAVIESVHAEAVLRANESGIRQGVQQSGMTFAALRVRVRGDEPTTSRVAQARRRRANERET